MIIINVLISLHEAFLKMQGATEFKFDLR